MKKNRKKSTNRAKKLLLVCTLCASILIVSTYAWFIGMKTVNVSSFDIKIATTEGLWLSMNGSDWSYTLDDITNPDKAYEGNTNTWASTGLIPVSTVGDMDKSSSRMMLYEKGSLTTTPGGYRLLTSRVNNHTTGEDGKLVQGKGYVAFDLFIKNLSGDAYYATNTPDNEEAIYLTTNSEVKVAESGGVAGTGIENSVRVAFAQIGRVKADTSTVKNITDISCSNVDAATGQVQVTGICRSAQIWEPNDTKHAANAINWYDVACSKRFDADLTKEASYLDPTSKQKVDCSAVTNGEAYSTYAISRALIVGDDVDVYDGPDYNTYAANKVDYDTYSKASAEDKAGYKLVDFPYFTDTDKVKTGTSRPTFMTLAPNSITKVRVYVFIEGQDIDNYDFASLGAKISVNFGFTKERFTETDVNYSGPSTDITVEPTKATTAAGE